MNIPLLPPDGRRCSALLAGWVMLYLVLLGSSCSTNLFYLPQRYSSPHYYRLLHNPSLTHIQYDVDGAEQTAFYLGRFEKELPRQVWILFGGINSLALDWYQWFEATAGDDTGFLLIDYPGYGLNKGYPREKKMVTSGIAATAALMSLFGTDRVHAPFQLNVLGHSLGSGIAIHFADRISVDRLLLIAPFTSMVELVQYRYGWLQGLLITLINPEQYRNRERLAGIVRRNPRPEIVIIHGKKDTVIPASMGQQLAETAGESATLHLLPEMGHKDMFAQQNDLITTIITGKDREIQ